jgi:hypothetical protein
MWLSRLLDASGLQHRADLFTCDESVVDLALELATSSATAAALVHRLTNLGLTKVGERQRLVGVLTRATRQLQMATASLLGPELEARLADVAGANLFALVATFPRSEESAVVAQTSATGALSIAGVVEAVIVGGVVEAAMADLLGTFAAQRLEWLTDLQVERLRSLSIFVLLCLLDTGLKPDGALAVLSAEQRQLCEGTGLLPLSSADALWRAALPQSCATGPGGPMLILSPPRSHLWSETPPCLMVIPAVMGGTLPEAKVSRCLASARRTLTRGELGILCSNALAWRRALDAGWDWALVLEDDAHFNGDEQGMSLASFLARLPALIDAATAHDPEWSLLVLSPVNTPYDFFRGTPEYCVPQLMASPSLIRQPQALPKPKAGVKLESSRASAGGGSGTETGPSLSSCWRRCPPTYHAFAWIYRRPLMERCVADFAALDPPLEPLDIWVWEVAAAHGLLGHALCLSQPLIDKGKNLHSIKEQQDNRDFLNRVYAERGYGK